MKMISRLTLVICLLFSFSVNAAGESNSLVVNSRDQAIQLVKGQYQGKVLKAEASQVNGHSGYSVKLISQEGLVFYVSVDAQTGQVSRR
ncbi:PepSY domain-containing protein [Psychromonas sp. KJ10-10]|uniref:PepSY domain-containing protein n=1 Tax=Psychromonas sp. KJ10-10 TaxID=3391823 RepID=UPI0039B55D39